MIGAKSVPVAEPGGGVERHVEELAERLARRKHVVFVYVRSALQPKRHQKTWRKICLIPLPTVQQKHLGTIVHTLLATLHVIFMPVDVIHYHGVGPATFAWIPRIFKPTARVVVTFHGIDRFHKKWGPFARAYLGFGEWAALHFPHRTIVVSHTLQLYVHRRFGRPGTFIPNGVTTQTIRTTDRIKRFNLRKAGYLLVVARLVKHKGLHYLIQAFRGIKTNKKLVIVGAPSFTEDYAEYLAELAADDPRILFTGFQGGETLSQLFTHAYLYIHPSESEGLSTTILESMAYGTTVLISDIPENLETIDHSGFAFKNQNVHDLRKQLQRLLKNPKVVQERARRGRAFIKQNFNWERVLAATEEVYAGRRVTSPKPRAQPKKKG
jgi:glycosyltransferase involved in cell wall biosynthesis